MWVWGHSGDKEDAAKMEMLNVYIDLAHLLSTYYLLGCCARCWNEDGNRWAQQSTDEKQPQIQ